MFRYPLSWIRNVLRSHLLHLTEIPSQRFQLICYAINWKPGSAHFIESWSKCWITIGLLQWIWLIWFCLKPIARKMKWAWLAVIFFSSFSLNWMQWYYLHRILFNKIYAVEQKQWTRYWRVLNQRCLFFIPVSLVLKLHLLSGFTLFLLSFAHLNSSHFGWIAVCMFLQTR